MTKSLNKYFDQKWKKQILRILLFIVLTLCYLFFFTNSEGQAIIKSNYDGDFHFSRLLSLQNIWQSPVNFNYFDHTGEIVNLMYPWGTLYPMYLIFKVTNDFVSAYYIYFGILTFITLELTYWCAKKMKQSSSTAIIVAALYTFSMPRSSDIYCRMAVGEAIALTFFPLVVLGIYQIFYEEQPHWITLATGMTLLVYSHVLSLAVAAGVVALFLVLNLIRKNVNKAKLFALLKATGMSLLLGIGFLIPMLQIMHSIDLNNPMVHNLFQAALKPGDLITKSLNNSVDGVLTFNVIYIIVIVLLFINFRKINGFFRDSLLMGALLTILSTTIFPWDMFQKMFEMLQFPWRLIGIAGLFLAIAFAPVIQDYAQKHSKKSTTEMWLLILSGILLCHFGTLDGVGSINGWKIGDTQEVFKTKMKDEVNFNGLDDYAPKIVGTDLESIHNQQICANAAWHPLDAKRTSSKVTYTYDSPNATTAFLPVFNYPGEVVKHNGTRIEAEQAQDGATLVNLDEGKNVFEVSFEYTKLARLSWLVSLVAFVGLLGWVGYQKFKVKR